MTIEYNDMTGLDRPDWQEFLNINDMAGFYKLDQDSNFFFAPNFVYSPTVTLLRSDYLTYSYPQDGWYWFDDYLTAKLFFGLV